MLSVGASVLKTFYHSSHYHFSILGENNKPDIFLIMKVMHTYTLYLWLIHVDVWQNPTQYSKIISSS